MGTVNEDLADALVSRRLDVLRYEATVSASLVRHWVDYIDALIREAERINRRARNADRGLTRAERRRLRDIRDRLGAGLSGLQEELEQEVRQALEAVAETEAAAIVSMLDTALPPTDPADGLTVAVVPPSDLARAITDPVGGMVWTHRLRRDLADANGQVQSIVADALARGASMKDAAKALKAVSGLRETYRTRFEAIAKTEIQRVANTAAADTYRQNRDIVGAVQYLATLDSRTCLVCAPLHNKIIPLNPDGSLPVLIPGTPYRMPPIHPRCRCFVAPVSRSFRELGIDLDDAAERDRLDGRAAINMDFASWLRRQPLSKQVEVLGKRRARLWRGNRLKLEQFSDAGRALSLEELRARYPGRVPAA